jgi:carbamoyltransferase
MGMAPYGDPGHFRQAFSEWYKLLPEGDYALDDFSSVEFRVFWADRIGEIKKDDGTWSENAAHFAASLQEVVEKILLHVVTHFKEVTGAKYLTMAGGVAHNCSANGKIAYSGIFDGVWVHPAAHDAGAVVGAGLWKYKQETGKFPATLENVYWGPNLGHDLEGRLEIWSQILAIEKFSEEKVCLEVVAKRLAKGQVAGWIQGRSEFGPRALGNRSIIADPRPSSHKDRINALVKKREGFRPFAPSVLIEDVEDWFDVPTNMQEMGYMTFVLKVKEDKRSVLGAVTHIDGTARVQTVDEKDNKRYSDLIRCFKKETGVPVLLNTSFNNNVEPIVNSLEDAICCFLTTGLDFLVVEGTFLIEKKDFGWEHLKEYRVTINPYASFSMGQAPCHFGRIKRWTGPDMRALYPLDGPRFQIENPSFSTVRSIPIHEVIGFVLFSGTGKLLIEILEDARKLESEITIQEFMDNITSLWGYRLISLNPQ